MIDEKSSHPAQLEASTARCFRAPESLFEAITFELRGFVRGFPWQFSSKHKAAGSKDEILLKLSDARRLQVLDEHADLPVATDKRNIRLPNDFASAISKTLIDHLIQTGFAGSATASGSLLYPPGGWMGWHTNSDRVGWRLYVNYVTRGGRSFFRWSEGGEVRTDYDLAGFNFRAFRTGPSGDPFWHCVYADEWRLSLGYWLELRMSLHTALLRTKTFFTSCSQLRHP